MRACILFSFSLLLLASCASVQKTTGPKTDDIVRNSTPTAADSAGATAPPTDSTSGTPADSVALSPASDLMIEACDNYLAVNPRSERAPEVLMIKASTLYNNGAFASSRTTYKHLLDSFPESPERLEAIRMIAQSFYEEKSFEEAQLWYAKMRDAAGDGTQKEEAKARIAESMFKMAESFEEAERFEEAAQQYERVALEFPDAKIADVALYNAGLAYEKLASWSHAILSYQKLFQKYGESSLLAKARFRTAKCYEKMLQWDNAGEAYLRVVSINPRSELAPAAMYNAGFCFENAGKLVEAAMTFEKLSRLYPKSDDVADVLFKAGDIYGKLKDWESVTRVNQEFSRRFGNDKDRIVQAQCMIGIALYMQDKINEAVQQLQTAVTTYERLKNPSAANKYYAANAQFTMAEIAHEQMKQIQLVQPQNIYKQRIRQKSDLLDVSLERYSRVLAFGVIDWTTRSIFQMGQLHEDFGIAVLKQPRPSQSSLSDQIALELGIAKALEEYFVEHALHYHEQNVKLAIKEKVEDKHMMASRKKLTYLPFMAGNNYLELTSIFAFAQEGRPAEGFALIAEKLESLQKIAPFQERAMELFLKALEMGSMYEQVDDFYRQASTLIIKTGYSVGEIYADVAMIAREAPIPEGFDPYEAFVYKTKLLTQVESYEDQAFESYLRALKIGEAYTISDDYIEQCKENLAQLLFLRGRCYDLLAIQAFQVPPFPNGISEAEQQEYTVQFQEIGIKLQEQAFSIYREILEYRKQGYAAGKYVTHAYVRLYQYAPDLYGVEKELVASRSFGSGPQWVCDSSEAPNWYGLEFADSSWNKVHRAVSFVGDSIEGFPETPPDPMWYGTGNPRDTGSYQPVPELFVRRSFYLAEPPRDAQFFLSAFGAVAAYLNEKPLVMDSSSVDGHTVRSWDLAGIVREGKNVLALRVNNSANTYGIRPFVQAQVRATQFLPQPPGMQEPLEPEDVLEGTYKFEYIKNFSLPRQQEATVR